MSHHKRPIDFSSNNSDKIYIKKLEMKLEKEKKKRLYYQKLYEELKEKNKYLYTQLLNKSINSSSLNKSSQLGTELVSEAKLNKMILNDININHLDINNNIPKKVRNRALSLKFRNLNKLSINSSGTGTNSPSAFKNKTIKNKLGLEFKGRSRSKSISQNYFNITKNIKVLDNDYKINTQVNSSLSSRKNNSQNSLNLDKMENNDTIKKKKTKTKNIRDKKDNE